MRYGSNHLVTLKNKGVKILLFKYDIMTKCLARPNFLSL